MKSPTPIAALLALSLGSLAHAADGEAAGIPPPPEFPVDDPAAYGVAVKEYVDRINSGWKDEISVAEMTLVDAGGAESKRSVNQMQLEQEAGDKSVIRFQTPAEVKGVAALTHQHPGRGDDSWLYLPANRKVQRISGANKTASFQGTEFTYEDLGEPALEDYAWTHLGMEDLPDGRPAHKIESVPTDADSGYSRVVSWLDAEHWRTERTEYFDKAREPLKVMEASDWELFHGRWWRPRSMVIRNLQTGKRTEMRIEKRFMDLSRYPGKGGKPRENLTEEHFTTRRLEGR